MEEKRGFSTNYTNFTNLGEEKKFFREYPRIEREWKRKRKLHEPWYWHPGQVLHEFYELWKGERFHPRMEEVKMGKGLKGRV